MSTATAESTATRGLVLVDGRPEKRVAPRVPGALVRSISGVRLSQVDGEAFLVNISTTGLLARCSTKLTPGTVLTVSFDGSHSVPPVKSRVVRCVVSDIDGSGMLWYHIGIAFHDAIKLEESAAVMPREPDTVQPPAHVRGGQTEPINRW